MTSGDLADGIGGSAARKLPAAGGDLIAAARLRIPVKPAGACIRSPHGHEPRQGLRAESALSEYLAGVRAGKTVVVCDRNTPIARIVPYDERDAGFVVHEAQRPAAEVRKVRGVKPRKQVDVVRLLREDRDQR
jgi:prevent-host-death family protein